MWSGAYFFCLLSAYYIIRPMRDEMGVAGGVQNVPWLFTGTLTAMLLLNPPFAALVVKLPRMRFVSITYRFFMANLLIFFVLLRVSSEAANIWVGRTFYIWTSVFNLFIVSVFWAFMVDIFRTEQGKRLFGFIGIGGTLGAVLGSSITASLAQLVGPANLLLVSIVLLEVGVMAVRRLSALLEGWDSPAPAKTAETPIGGNIWAGITHATRSPYLLGIVAFMLLYTIAATFLYFQQLEIAESAFSDRGARTAFFARVDLMVNILTLLTQAFLTGRILKAFGVALTLAFLPALCVVGFTTLGMAPTIGIIVIFQVLRRASNFALARPTREVLYTVLSREDKYKAKAFIDTFVYRAGDQVGAWSYALMGWMGLTMAGIAFAAVPLSLVWLTVALWLGRRQESMARDARAAAAPGAVAAAS